MRHCHFDAVQPAVAATLRGRAICLENLRELVDRSLASGPLRYFRTHGRSADDRIARGLHRADMGKLREHQTAFLMHRCR